MRDINEIADKMHKISGIDIYDYVQPRRNDYANIDTLDTGKHQPPFCHWSIDSGIVTSTYEEEHYNKVISRLESITDCLLNGMAKECKKLFNDAGYPTVDVCDITEKDYSKRFSAYLSKCNDILYKHYDADIAIKLAEIKLKYYRPRLYNSLFYAYCQLHDIASRYNIMHSKREKDKQEIIKLLGENRQKCSRCLTLAKNCIEIRVVIRNNDFTEIRVKGKAGQSESIPDECFSVAGEMLMGKDSFKWITERDCVTLIFDNGQEFEDVKEWLINTLSVCKGTDLFGYDKRFAKSFNGLYRYVKDYDFVGNLNFLTKKNKSDKIRELIRFLFDLQDNAEVPMRNHINRNF